MTEKAIVIDIDGCILDSSKVLKTMKEKNYDWNYFDCNCNSDEVELIGKIKPFIYAFEKNIKIIISTARTEKIRPQTARKLWKHRIQFEDMYMRDINDYREDYEVKKDHIKSIMHKYNIVAFIDDKEKNCDMANEFGLLSFKVM